MANPPITVGALTDVPAPESPINAQFHQEVANRIVQRFASKAALDAWAAEPGTYADVGTTPPVLYRRASAGWCRQTPWGKSLTGNQVLMVAEPGIDFDLATITVPTDPGPRVALIAYHGVFTMLPTADSFCKLKINGSTVRESVIGGNAAINYTANYRTTVALLARVAIAAATAPVVLVQINFGAQSASIPATQQHNRLEIEVVPDGGGW